MDLGSAFAVSVARHPGAEAVVDGTHRRTYAQWDRDIRAAAGTLARMGLASGDHFAVVMRNRHEMATLYWASHMLYTSGTTGRPKGVPRSHRAELAAGVSQLAHHLYRASESSLCVMPMFHTMGVRKMLATALVNGKLVCMPDYSPAGVLRLVE